MQRGHLTVGQPEALDLDQAGRAEVAVCAITETDETLIYQTSARSSLVRIAAETSARVDASTTSDSDVISFSRGAVLPTVLYGWKCILPP